VSRREQLVEEVAAMEALLARLTGEERIKCDDCPNQAFVPVDDAAILAHLRGQHVMGVYPLLQDETCWFLAVDFDKQSWAEDVAAFVGLLRPPFSEPGHDAKGRLPPGTLSTSPEDRLVAGGRRLRDLGGYRRD
jgi:hypothetical protein